MIKNQECDYCKNEFPISLNSCPHCAQPGLFPNVRLSKQNDEIDALENRYQKAIDDTKARNCEDVLKDFEKTVTQKSKAVIGRPLNETLRIANSDRELYSTYYFMLKAELKVPSGSKWDILRPPAEEVLFPHFKEHIRFGSLSLNENGLKNYGECSWVLKTEMIKHRTSVFEENCVMFMDHHDIKLKAPIKIPKGYRASWNDRGKLAAAKAVNQIQKTTLPEMYQEILLHNSSNSENDRFIEAHIWGPITLKTMEKITVKKPKNSRKKLLFKILQKKLQDYDLLLEAI